MTDWLAVWLVASLTPIILYGLPGWVCRFVNVKWTWHFPPTAVRSCLGVMMISALSATLAVLAMLWRWAL